MRASQTWLIFIPVGSKTIQGTWYMYPGNESSNNIHFISTSLWGNNRWMMWSKQYRLEFNWVFFYLVDIDIPCFFCTNLSHVRRKTPSKVDFEFEVKFLPNLRKIEKNHHMYFISLTASFLYYNLCKTADWSDKYVLWKFESNKHLAVYITSSLGSSKKSSSPKPSPLGVQGMTSISMWPN